MAFEAGFNPRTRRACDVSICPDIRRILSFNPRTRRACDNRPSQNYNFPPVSIHARVERATRCVADCCYSQQSFNPRTRRACDKDFYVKSKLACKFQSTHA